MLIVQIKPCPLWQGYFWHLWFDILKHRFVIINFRLKTALALGMRKYTSIAVETYLDPDVIEKNKEY